MHEMFRITTQQHETNVFQYPHICMALGIGLLLIVAGCTSTSTPTARDLPSQEHHKEIGSNASPKKEKTYSFNSSPDNPAVKVSLMTTGQLPETPETDEVVAKGKGVYQEHCANCHGIEGDGQGPLAVNLSTKPQNFTKGVYKFRSTPSGELPTDDDLLRTISVGISGTAMEGYQELPKPDRMALVAYLKSLSPRFLKSQQGTPIIFPLARPHTPESVTRGRHLYGQMYCSACHGLDGRGDGELAQKLTDTAGRPIQPADLTQKRLKSGEGPEAIYRTIMTGLDGTPMPSYGDSLDLDEGWDLALYIFSLAITKETL